MAVPLRQRWRGRAFMVESVLVATWATLSFLLCFFVATDGGAQLSALITVASLMTAMSCLLVLSVVALRRNATRQLRLGLRQASLELRSIERVTDPALSFLPLEDLLQSVLARTQESVGGDVVFVLLRSDEQTLYVRAAHGAVELAPVGAEMRLGGDHLEAPGEWGPAVIDDVRLATLVSDSAAPAEMSSLMVAPLPIPGSVIGVLGVGSKEHRSFDPYDLRLVQVVADRCAAAIERARLDEAERRSRLGADHARLHLSVLARVGTVLGRALETYDDALNDLGEVVVPDFADWFAVDVLDVSGQLRRVTARWSADGLVIGRSGAAVPHRHPRGDELIRIAIAERRAQVVLDASRSDLQMDATVHALGDGGQRPFDVESMMIVPIRARGGLSGALSFVTGPERRAYRPSDLETAKDLADRVGVAIERVTSWQASRLAEQAALWHVERLRGLVEAALVVNAQLAEEEVIELLAEHAHRVLPADVIVICSLPEGRLQVEKAWPSSALGVPAFDDAGGLVEGESQPPEGRILALRNRELLAAIRAATDAAVRSGRPHRWSHDPSVGEPGQGSPTSPPEGASLSPGDCLAVPLTDSDGESRRVVVALGGHDGQFSAEDESVLTLLAQMASVALQNAHLYEDVRSNSNRLEAVVESSPLAIAEFDVSGQARWWNSAAADLLGWGDVTEPRRVTVQPGSERVLAELWNRARGGKPSVGIGLTVSGPRGDTLELSVSTAPLTELGKVSGVLLVADDITERQRLLEQFHQAERLSAMTRMAGAVAHDFNNLLTVILGCSDVLMRRVESHQDLAEEVAAIQQAGQRAAALTSRLVGIGQHRPIQPEEVDVDLALMSLQPMLGGVLGDDVELVVTRQAGAARILIDRSELERSVLNLAINARDAMPDGGRFVVGTGLAASKGPGVSPTVQISFSDTGAGMAPDVMAHCFEPFFTTKGRAQGTGLGLATVHAMVVQAGGEIQVESTLEKGTRFTMTFPAVQTPGGELPSLPTGRRETRWSMRSKRSAGQAVLIVDDEPEVLRLAIRELEGRGYTAVPAGSSAEALQALQVSQGDVALLVTDVVMPGMNGVELAGAVGRLYPGTPVLFISGHLEDQPARGSLPPDADLLLKPFTPGELSARVAEAIDRRTNRPTAPLRQGSKR